jgi:hypothetical protein
MRPRVRDLKDKQDLLAFFKEIQQKKDEKSSQEIIDWCRQRGLMPKDSDDNDEINERPFCDNCKSNGQLKRMKWSPRSTGDKWCWGCNSCTTYATCRKNSFFALSRLSIPSILLVIFFLLLYGKNRECCHNDFSQL